MAADLTSLTKTLYDLHKSQEPAMCKGSPLEQLVIERFDEEQIWQELELQNTALLKHFETVVGQAVSDDSIALLEEEEENVDDAEEGEDGDQGEMGDEEEEDQEEPSRKSKTLPGDGAEDVTDDDSDLDFDVDALEKQEKQKRFAGKGVKTRGVPSVVDDRFFKLSDMESFLDDMDKREGKDEGSNDDLDYFQDLPSDDDDDLDLDEDISSKKQKKGSTGVCIII